jgi:hypothetical protein
MGSVEAVLGLGLLVLVADLAGRRSAWGRLRFVPPSLAHGADGISVPLLMTTSV